MGIGVVVVMGVLVMFKSLGVPGVLVVSGVLVVLVVLGVLVVVSPRLAFGSWPKMRSGMPRRVILATVAAPMTQSLITARRVFSPFCVFPDLCQCVWRRFPIIGLVLNRLMLTV